jgi:hypothetical protein
MIYNYLTPQIATGQSQYQSPVMFGSTPAQPAAIEQGSVPLSTAPLSAFYGADAGMMGEPNMGAPVSDMSLPEALGESGWGSALGGIGTVGGLALGVPGLGVLGAAAGTAADFMQGQGQLEGYNSAPMGGVQAASLGFTDALSGFVNSMTSGLFGNSVQNTVDTAIASAIGQGMDTGLEPGMFGGFGFDGYGMDPASGGFSGFGGGYGL